MKIESTSLEQTREVAALFVQELKPTMSQATVVCLSGDLGAGKTTLTQSIASVLGVGELVTSPTFVIEKIYQLPAGTAFKRLIHIDAYRLSGGEELNSLGWSEIVADPDNLIIIEWPERVADKIPHNSLTITLQFINETTHSIEW